MRSWERKISRQVGIICAAILLAANFGLSYVGLTAGIMWFVTALIGVAAIVVISVIIDHNRMFEYFGRISLTILCVHGPVYRVIVKLVSIPMQMTTDAVRENFLLAMLVVVITLGICGIVYEAVCRVAPWMIGKRR